MAFFIRGIFILICLNLIALANTFFVWFFHLFLNISFKSIKRKIYFVKANCNPDWYNFCKSPSDCCSGICDNHDGQWLYGLCMPKSSKRSLHHKPANDESSSKNNKKMIARLKRSCKSNWDNTCRSSSECCSNNCDNHDGQWLDGVCKP